MEIKTHRRRDPKLVVDEIITSGGIIGKIEKVSDNDKIELLIADNVTVTIIRSTVQSLLNNPAVKKNK